MVGGARQGGPGPAAGRPGRRAGGPVPGGTGPDDHHARSTHGCASGVRLVRGVPRIRGHGDETLAWPTRVRGRRFRRGVSRRWVRLPGGEPVTPGFRTRRCVHARIRLFPGERGARAGGSRRAGPDGRAGRVPGTVDLRPLPPVERRAGPEPLRVVGDRGGVAGGVAADRDGGDLPDRADAPGGDRARRRDQRGDDRRPFPAGPGHRRGAQRAHPRRPLAPGARPPGDAGGGGAGDAPAVHRRGGQPPRPALHRGERPPLHRPGRARADRHLRVRAQGDLARLPGGRRLHHDDAEGRDGHRLPQGRRRGRTRQRRHEGLLRRRPRRVRPHRAPALVQRAAARRDGPGAALPTPLRAAARAGHRGHGPGERRLRRRPRRARRGAAGLRRRRFRPGVRQPDRPGPARLLRLLPHEGAAEAGRGLTPRAVSGRAGRPPPRPCRPGCGAGRAASAGTAGRGRPAG
ncbi:hypothetical protein SGPA1_10477 [Streptomyces misionensis JCM 4497]